MYLISDYLKIQVFVKIGFMLQATHLIIYHPKSKIYKNFWTAIPRNKQNMFIAILLSYFIYILLISFIQNCRNLGEAYSEPYQIFKITFLAKIAIPEAYSQRSRTSNMELFEKKKFSCPVFQSFTINTKTSILHVQYRSEHTSGAVNYFYKGSILILEWVLDTPLTCLKKDKDCEKPVNK